MVPLSSPLCVNANTVLYTPGVWVLILRSVGSGQDKHSYPCLINENISPPKENSFKITQLVCGEAKDTGICFLRLSSFSYATISKSTALKMWFSPTAAAWEQAIHAHSQAPPQT